MLSFSSCVEDNKKIKITTSTWIGYAPLFYAKEKNWLEPLNIKLLNVVSLSENMYLLFICNHPCKKYYHRDILLTIIILSGIAKIKSSIFEYS